LFYFSSRVGTKRVLVFAVFAAAVIPFDSTAQTIAVSQKGQITANFTEWGSSYVRVQITNWTYAEGRYSQPDGYALAESDFGAEAFRTHTAALLTAFASEKYVQLTLSGCTNNLQKILGVAVANQ
jgi:hypothetical protein